VNASEVTDAGHLEIPLSKLLGKVKCLSLLVRIPASTGGDYERRIFVCRLSKSLAIAFLRMPVCGFFFDFVNEES